MYWKVGSTCCKLQTLTSIKMFGKIFLGVHLLTTKKLGAGVVLSMQEKA